MLSCITDRYLNIREALYMSSFNLAILFKVLCFVLQLLRSLACRYIVDHLIIALRYENILAVQEKENVYCVQRNYKESETLYLKK